MKLDIVRKGLLALAGMVLASAAAYATPITVNNFSFEEPADPLAYSCGAGCSYGLGVPSGWTGTGLVGRWIPGATSGNFNYFDYIPDGSAIVYSMGGTLSQIVGTVEVGVNYTLLVDWGHRKHGNFDPNSLIALNIGGTSILATGVDPELGGWSTFAALYTGTEADAGKTISIDLQSNDQGNFDNVRLDADRGNQGQTEDIRTDQIDLPSTDVPEMPSSALLGMGLAGLLLLRRTVAVRRHQN